jgi:hypothetical protein
MVLSEAAKGGYTRCHVCKPPVLREWIVERLTLSDALRIAEEQAKIEAKTASLIEADSPERLADWQSTQELLRVMKERGAPESLRDD